MTTTFDRIAIAVPDLSAAVEQYQRLFDTPPSVGEFTAGELVARWSLPNTMIELVQGVVERPQIQGLVFALPAGQPLEMPMDNSIGLDIRVCDRHSSVEFRDRHPKAECAALSVDHVVLRTSDAQSCIDLFSGELGIRLALDKTVPEWGGRMLFFRAGKLTLEVIESAKDEAGSSVFWGLAYQCPDLANTVRELGVRGVAVSAVREGRKPGTLVATVKSHCLEIPTLLIQPAI